VKIHFSNVNFSSRSGPNTFAFRLANELTSRGHDIVGVAGEYDVFLAFIEPSSPPQSGALFVQRLDGIWFKPEQFESHNRLIKSTYETCDYVIWQSQFDRDMTEHYWGERAGEVIRNGISSEEGSDVDFILKRGHNSFGDDRKKNKSLNNKKGQNKNSNGHDREPRVAPEIIKAGTN